MMKAFVEYFDKRAAEEMEIVGIHSSKDGLRLVMEELPFSDDRYDKFISYEELQKITIYDLRA